ncbi:MAG: hypothetical protein QXO76_11855 [Thermoproteota archaeon]
MSKNPRELVGYCGLYCGACGIYQGRIKLAVENLRKVINAYGFDRIAPELAKWDWPSRITGVREGSRWFR